MFIINFDEINNEERRDILEDYILILKNLSFSMKKMWWILSYSWKIICNFVINNKIGLKLIIQMKEWLKGKYYPLRISISIDYFISKYSFIPLSEYSFVLYDVYIRISIHKIHHVYALKF